MNSEDLDLMLSNCNLDDCVAFFKGASETDRKLVSKRALQWFQIADATRISKLPTIRPMIREDFPISRRVQKALDLVKQTKKETIPAKARSESSIEAAALAVMATCGITEVRELGIRSLPHTLSILRDRNPKWLNKWMVFACEQDPFGAWQYVHSLESEGLAEAERGPWYWASMAFTLGLLDAEQLLKKLRSERELLDVHVWNILACDQAIQGLTDPPLMIKESSYSDWVPGSHQWETYSSNLNNALASAAIWKVCLVELATSGELNRNRLYDFLFDWIARLGTDGESKPSTGGKRPVTWFQEIIDELALTDKENDELTLHFVSVLSAKDPNTLVWSLDKLNQVDAAALPLRDLLGNISNVFFVKRKEPAVAAVKLLENLIKKFPENKQIWTTLLDAFEHNSNDVHKRALSVIKKQKLNERASFSEQLAERLAGASALVRDEAKGLAKNGASGGHLDAPPVVPPLDIEAILRDAADIPEPLCEAAGIFDAVYALKQGILPGALALESAAIPRLGVDARVEPLQSIDDVVFLLARILESNGDAESIEQVLDGMLRFCDQRPIDFEQRVSAVRKKIGAMLGEDNPMPVMTVGFQGSNAVMDLAAVARAWIDPPSSKFSASQLLSPIVRAVETGVAMAIDRPAALWFFSERTRAIAQLVSKRIALPLLSTPTHKGGWIDPRVVPDRIQQWNNAGVKLEKTDLIQALLRLAPEYRERALSEVGPSKNESLSALRWALGGPLEGSVSSAEIWTAAFRCRDPRGDSPELAKNFPGLGPDTAQMGSYDECLKDFGSRSTSIFGVAVGFEKQSLVIKSNPPVKARPSLKFFPTELLHTDEIGWQGSRVLDCYWPLNRESFLALEARRLSLFIESTGSYWQNSLDVLFDPDTPMRGYGCWVVALGMAAKQDELARLSVDALICCIDDSRLDSTTFGITLGKLFVSDRITLSRWIKGLKVVARISSFHQYFVFKALEQLLVTADSGVPGLSKAVPAAILELMYECCSNGPYRVELESARLVLSRFEGKGKSAKLAKLLMEPSKPGTSEFVRELVHQVILNRVERSRRWQSWLQAPVRSPELAHHL